MVRYWMNATSTKAKVTTIQKRQGHYVMYMKGEKYPFPGYPRGVLLYGPLSPLKHEIKNQIFNYTWYELEKPLTPVGHEEIILHLKHTVLPNIMAIFNKGRYDLVPPDRLQPPVKELWRALSVVEQKTGSTFVRDIKELLCFILEEDDAYRFRFQWMCKFFNPRSFWSRLGRKTLLMMFDSALSMLEHGETVGDMKERQRLLRRCLMFFLTSESVRSCFELFAKEVDWKKLRLSKADKYFFRAKYFKVDWPEYEY